MPKYRKKPIVIDAERVSTLHYQAGGDWKALPGWVVEAYEAGTLLFLNHPSRIEIRAVAGTLAGTMTAHYEDLLIRGAQGRLYPCEPDVFAQTYELVEG